MNFLIPRKYKVMSSGFHLSSNCLLFVLLLTLQICSIVPMAPVEFLPGFDGPLPFELETGYIGVGEEEDVQLFYYFFKSEGNSKDNPLLLWLTGGPGCSSLSAIFYEIGPITFDLMQHDHDGVPKLVLNPYSWTKKASIIFLELPVGTGFSYGRNPKASQSTDLQSTEQAYEFLRKWLVAHPEFLSNDFYVGGDSYVGITVPIITQAISNGNNIGIEPHIDLKGYMIGNPYTHLADYDSRIVFSHGMGLIPDELYKSLEETCRGNYYNVNPKNELCLLNMQRYNEVMANVNHPQILEPHCAFLAPKPSKTSSSTRFLHENSFHSNSKMIRINSEQEYPYKCRNDKYKYASRWSNDEKVRESINVAKGTIGTWMRCRDELPYTMTIDSSLPFHANLSVKGYRSLIYSGDHDWLVPFVGTQAWIKSLNYEIVQDWHPWILDGQVAGYTKTYANRMTYATVKGGGHTAPQYKPAECKTMFERWISAEPL